MIYPTNGGAVVLTTAADAPTDVTYNALRLENSATPRIRATLSQGAYFTNAMEFDSTGRLVYVDATAGLPAGTTYANGYPFDTNGALCVSTGPAVTFSNGVPYAANGAVAATIIL